MHTTTYMDFPFLLMLLPLPDPYTDTLPLAVTSATQYAASIVPYRYLSAVSHTLNLPIDDNWA